MAEPALTPATALLEGIRRLDLAFLPYVPCSTAAGVLRRSPAGPRFPSSL